MSPAAVAQAGARLNSMFQARDGLPASFFPSEVPIYSGHYHIPHTVDGASNIRYVGSPYQGAGLCPPLPEALHWAAWRRPLGTCTWPALGAWGRRSCCAVTAGEAGQDKALLILDAQFRVLREVPLDVGPRHFNLPAPGAALPADLRQGDRRAALVLGRCWACGFSSSPCKGKCIAGWAGAARCIRRICGRCLAASALKSWRCAGSG